MKKYPIQVSVELTAFWSMSSILDFAREEAKRLNPKGISVAICAYRNGIALFRTRHKSDNFRTDIRRQKMQVDKYDKILAEWEC